MAVPDYNDRSFGSVEKAITDAKNYRDKVTNQLREDEKQAKEDRSRAQDLKKKVNDLLADGRIQGKPRQQLSGALDTLDQVISDATSFLDELQIWKRQNLR